MSASRHASLPPFIIPFSVLSMVLSAAVLGLSIINFGLLSRWYNAAAAILAILFHAVLIYRIRRHPRYVPPMVVVIPIGSAPPTAPSSMNEKSHQDIVHSTPDLHAVHHMGTLLSLTFLNIIYLVAFGLMMDITIRGGKKSTLPAERAEGMTYPWNIKVQIAQTVLVGVEALTLGIILATSLIGRARIAQLQDEEQENVEYGLEKSEKYPYDGF